MIWFNDGKISLSTALGLSKNGDAIIEIGNKIRAIRRSKGMNAISLADDSDISPTQISAIENGSTVMGIDSFLKICRALSADPSMLLPDELYGSFSGRMIKINSNLKMLPEEKKDAILNVIEEILNIAE